MASPGKQGKPTTHQESSVALRHLPSSPIPGVGVRTPAPMNDNPAVNKIAMPMLIEIWTLEAVSALGSKMLEQNHSIGSTVASGSANKKAALAAKALRHGLAAQTSE